MVEWKAEADLNAAFASHKIEASVTDGKNLWLKSGNSQLNITSGKALFIVENDKPVSLCSGTNCEDRLKYFFGLKG